MHVIEALVFAKQTGKLNAHNTRHLSLTAREQADGPTPFCQ